VKFRPYRRRAVFRWFVRLNLFDADQAAGMLTWPHSGFHVHTADGVEPICRVLPIAPSTY